MQGTILAVALSLLVAGTVSGAQGDTVSQVTPELPAELQWVLFVQADEREEILHNEARNILYKVVHITKGAKMSWSWRQGCGQGERFLVPGDDGNTCTVRYSAFIIYRFDVANQEVPDIPVGSPWDLRLWRAAKPMFVGLNTEERSSQAEIWVREGFQEELSVLTEVYGELLRQRKLQEQEREQEQERGKGSRESARRSSPGVVLFPVSLC